MVTDAYQLLSKPFDLNMESISVAIPAYPNLPGKLYTASPWINEGDLLYHTKEIPSSPTSMSRCRESLSPASGSILKAGFK